RLLELLRREVRDVPGLPLERGVVDQDVQPAELRGRALDDVAAVLPLAQVAVERERAAAGVAYPTHSLARVVLLGVVGDGHVGAALELARAPVALLAVVRRGPQLGLPARPPLLLLFRPAASPFLRQRARALVQAVPALLRHDHLPPAPWPFLCLCHIVSAAAVPAGTRSGAAGTPQRGTRTEREDRWRRSRSHAPAWPAPCSRWSSHWCARGWA